MLHQVRGWSHMTSAKNGGVQTPPPAHVSQNQNLPAPPSPLCQPTSAFGQPPPLRSLTSYVNSPLHQIKVLKVVESLRSFSLNYNNNKNTESKKQNCSKTCLYLCNVRSIVNVSTAYKRLQR